MESEHYEVRSVAFEGGDQVGKGDAAINIAKELSEKGEDVVLVSFPFYATPIGTSIRLVLSGGYGEFKNIPEMKDSVGNSRQTECVMALFALNRLETMSCLANLAKEGKLLVFDRCSYSHALTISYNKVSGAIQEEDLNNVINSSLKMDAAFIETLKLKNCVLQLYRDHSEWCATRGEGEDIHESKDVQEICDDVYAKFAEQVGKGWHKVVTREGSSWRERSEIKNEIMEFIDTRMHIGNNGKKGSHSILTLSEATSCIYPDVKLHQQNISNWEEALKNNDKKGMYENAVKIGLEMSSNIDKIELDFATKNAMKDIFEEYPECFAILEHFLGKNYVVKLSSAIYG